MPELTVLDAALEYATRWGSAGAGILPLRGKVPIDPATGHRMTEWQRRATSDPEQLRRWWSLGEWNVGVAPRGAFYAFDVDRRTGDDDRLHDLERRLCELPVGPTCQTSDGWRPLLAAPGVPLRPAIDGIKIICLKGQIVMPPSVHPETGFVYRWEADRAPGDLPLPATPEPWMAELRLPAPKRRHLHAVRDPGDDFLDGRPPPEYVELLTGVKVPPGGPNGVKIRCPLPGHRDRTPSFNVWPQPGRGWHCFGCGRTGGIYQLAALLGGIEPPLRGPDFLAVRDALTTAYERAYGVAA